MIANYLPLQDPYGGPNYFKMDPNALYEMHVANGGQATEAFTFQFRFTNTLDDNKLSVGGKQVSIPLVQNGSGDVDVPNDPALNTHENYIINFIKGDRRTGDSQPVQNLTAGGTTFAKPVDYIGTKTISDYHAYAMKHIYAIGIPGCGSGRVFVGQRKDPFVVNLGETFDPREHQVSRHRAQPGGGIRDRGPARRCERDVDHPRSADGVPHRQQGRHHRRLDHGQRADQPHAAVLVPPGLDPSVTGGG
jgi:hypothetical protein